MMKNGERTMKSIRSSDKNEAFTLLEVIIAASILALGLLSIVKVFPYGIETSRRAEDLTRATLLAQTMFESMKTDPRNFPILPGADSVLIPLPGNSYDDDTNNVIYSRTRNTVDLNQNGLPDSDYDGMPERDAVEAVYRLIPSANGIDDDDDGVIDDDGDSGPVNNRNNIPPRYFSAKARDGDLFYDPESDGRIGMDEEYADGKDDDGDGLIDDDCRLASVRLFGSDFLMPLLAGDGLDNDNDGEDNDNNRTTPAKADGIDNNGNGKIDEGIDEEIWNGVDDDGDGMIDEDCQNARFPFSPARFPAPYDRYQWQIFVGRIPDNGRFGIEDINGDGIPDLGDGIDNDGDGRVDEEIADGLDLDFPVVANRRSASSNFFRAYTQRPSRDGKVDEDCIASPLPDWRRVEIVVSWGGNGKDDDGDLARVDRNNTSTLGGEQTSRNTRSQQISYGAVEWGVDEEKEDGLDNDYDGKIDEDTYKYDFKLVGFINLENPRESFTLIGGQPRGLVTSVVKER